MQEMTDEAFRALLDDKGVLRPGAIPFPERSEGFTVFAQRTDARAETSEWARHAAQYFQVDLRLVGNKRYGDTAPREDAVRVALVPRGGVASVRVCFARPRTDDDLRAAEDAEAKRGLAGLSLLAKRCKTVWIVAAAPEEDRASLLLAAILASVVLGPILSPSGDELFGVRTARVKMEKGDGPYR